MIGQTISHYGILEKLGSGGMGVVYRAEDTRLGRSVALKFLPEDLSRDPVAIERFLREARAASALNHPHICAVYDVGEHAGRHFIVMEHLEGTPLHQHIGGQALPIDQVIDLGIQIADALDAAHGKRIIHRDIKPANIFVTGRGQAKLLDFGLVKPALEPEPAGASDVTTLGTTPAHLTSPGVVLGTVAYMSPEQVRGEELDARSDLFSLGSVLYEMATGQQAFSGKTAGTVQEAILNRTPVPAGRPNPDVPPTLEAIIGKALEKDRTLRYQNASDLRADLQRLRRDTDTARLAASGEGVPAPEATPSRRRRTALLAVGALVLTALAAGTWVARSRAGGERIDSVAVLPFTNATGDADVEYLSDGITESVINNLSQLPNLQVTARSRVFRYKGEVDPQKVGQELRVRAVLSGRLLRRDGTLIVRAELMDVAKGSQIWGGQYDRQAADVLALQANLSTEIARTLRLRLTGEEQQRLTGRNTEDPEAYQLYLKGRYCWNKRTAPGIQKALDYFQQAIDEDPAYTLAYAGLADAFNQSSFFSLAPPTVAMPKAKAAAAKALQIDDRLAEAHLSLAYASFTYDFDWRGAASHFEQALALSPASVRPTRTILYTSARLGGRRKRWPWRDKHWVWTPCLPPSATTWRCSCTWPGGSTSRSKSRIGRWRSTRISRLPTCCWGRRIQRRAGSRTPWPSSTSSPH